MSRLCLSVHGDLLCGGPQGHGGGCIFEPGWQLVRQLEDEPSFLREAVKKADGLLKDAWAREAVLAEVATAAEKERDAAQEALTTSVRALQFELDSARRERDEAREFLSIAEKQLETADRNAIRWMERAESAEERLAALDCTCVTAHEPGCPMDARGPA